MKVLMVAMLLFLTVGCSQKALDLEKLQQAVEMEGVERVLADFREPYTKEVDTENEGRQLAVRFLYEPERRPPGEVEKALEVSFQRGQKRTAYLRDSIVEGNIKQHLPQVSIIDVKKVPALGEQAYASLVNFGFGVLASVFFQKDDSSVLIELTPYRKRDRTDQNRAALIQLAEQIYSRL